MPRPLTVLATEQFEKEYAAIASPALRRKLMKELATLMDELEVGGPLPDSRDDTELAGWPGCHFAYLHKPLGLVYRLYGNQLQLLRLALDGEFLHF